jgi:hypothetical protein
LKKHWYKVGGEGMLLSGVSQDMHYTEFAEDEVFILNQQMAISMLT